MADNGKTTPDGLIVPYTPPNAPESLPLTCHRFFAPVVFPEPDKIDPRRANIIPRMGNFPCIGERCMMWNKEKAECWDVTAAKGQAHMGDYAFGKSNDVLIEGGGA